MIDYLNRPCYNSDMDTTLGDVVIFKTPEVHTLSEKKGSVSFCFGVEMASANGLTAKRVKWFFYLEAEGEHEGFNSEYF